jgi:uncharacterized membrane protein YdjX (TVP38/TMEM64 family)
MDEVSNYLATIKKSHPLEIFCIIVFLLSIDLLLSVPTIPVVIIAGNLLGTLNGTMASLIGFFILGSSAYFLGMKLGPKFIKFITKDEKEISKMKSYFQKNGKYCLLLSRACPMLPEISSCLAGMGDMSYKEYIKWYMAGSIPYALILTYSGSKVDVRNISSLLVILFSTYIIYSLIMYFFIIRNKKATL